MRKVNAVLGTIGLVGAVCCAVVAFCSPAGLAWLGWTIGATFQSHFAAKHLAAAALNVDADDE